MKTDSGKVNVLVDYSIYLILVNKPFQNLYNGFRKPSEPF